MKLTLAENIRQLRKQRKMTQEQLSAALGVTVGAVHKWETGLSVPELNLIVEMADFFDVSVDALLGYRMKDNRADSVTERLYACCRVMDPDGPAEAEKALGRYPHSFRIVYACADLYLAYGTGSGGERYNRRALELLEQARTLLPQNDNPRIGEASINGKMAAVYLSLGEGEKAVKLLKRNNADGLFSDQIGSTLAAFLNRTEEAAPYLSEAIIKGMTCALNVTLGFFFVYRSRNDWASALEITTWCSHLVAGLKAEGIPGYIDKTRAELLFLLGYVRRKAGQEEASLDALRKAAELAERFDSMPGYTLQDMRFLENAEQTTAFDILGTTAKGSIRYMLTLLDDGAFAAEWKEITHEE